MKTTAFIIALMTGYSASAQSNQPVVEDFKPSTLDQPGQQYPQVNSLVDDLIPYVDSHFRTMSDQPHRAMAG